MTRDQQIGLSTHEALQLEQEEQLRTVELLHGLIAQGAKGLGIINAGAVVAMLAFVQALVNRTDYHYFKPYAICALSTFLLGAFFSTIVFFFQYRFINFPHQDIRRKKLLHRIVWGLLIMSAALAFLGGIIITAGLYIAT